MARGRRIGSIDHVDRDEAARMARTGYRWNFRHCNGRYCSAENVVSGNCNGGCDGLSAAERRERTADETRRDWDLYEESAYTHAEDATRGNMQRRGARSSVLGIFWPKGRRPWRAASQELGEYWDGGGMVPVSLLEFKGGKRRPHGRPWEDTLDRRPRKKTAAKKTAAKKTTAKKTAVKGRG